MSWIANPTSGDHPREYGENTKQEMIRQLEQGPSPRIRGESISARSAAQILRTIPANTGRILRSFHLSKPVVGPSPRIRGESAHGLHPAHNPGTIPANTGRMGHH